MREDHEYHLDMLNFRFIWKTLMEKSSRKMDD